MSSNNRLEEIKQRLIAKDILSDEELLFYVIESLKNDVEDSWGSWRSNFAHRYYDPDEFHLGEVEEVDSWGGEGEGNRIGHVYYFRNHDVYLRIDGFYASHYGSDWDEDPYIVRPQTRSIVVYE